MKAIYLLAFALTLSTQAHARSGSGWTGVIIEGVSTTTLLCTDSRGNRLNFVEKVEDSNGGKLTRERHMARGEQGGSQNLDIRGELSSGEIDLQILHYGTENYDDAKVLGTLKGSGSGDAVFEGSIPLAFQQTLAGPLSLQCEFSQK